MCNVNRKNQISRLLGVVALASVLSTSAMANDAEAVELNLLNNTSVALEQTITKASKELFESAKQEFALSLQTQIAEQLFDSQQSQEQQQMMANSQSETKVKTAKREKQ